MRALVKPVTKPFSTWFGFPKEDNARSTFDASFYEPPKATKVDRKA